jgi:SAM-dependent methyltransferase
MDYGPETYGERVARVYDDWYKLGDPEPEAALLAELAAGGRALELGIGTGRIALPLAARGVEVHGIDASPSIVARMKEKPGGDKITVTIGDMADVPVNGEFALVFIVFNTFFMLTTQEQQVRCFRNVAAHLAPGGRFLVHTFVPDLSRVEAGEYLSVREAGVDHVRLDAVTFDRVNQVLDSTQIRLTEQGPEFVYAKLRYAFPPELDLMAQLAGLKLEARYSSFDKLPFDADSAFHVSIYSSTP